MESGSQADEPAERTPQRLASFIGVLIALLTLTVPIFAIALFSSTDNSPWPPSTEILPGSEGRNSRS
ncbi:MAG: hypothetical protein HC769_05925 [Cyanobacteria bacterium CRU_2_1]|nr:hypothetical protein [Cyanobacteria bacterium CRU_2_1]